MRRNWRQFKKMSSKFSSNDQVPLPCLFIRESITKVFTSSRESRAGRKHRRLFLHVFSSLSYPSVYSSHQFHFRLTSTFSFEIHLPLVILLTPPVKSHVTVGKEVTLSGPWFPLLTSPIKLSVILPSKMADLGLAKNCSSG